jgi:eukaryotic-like serine/threonine-protein kinase
MGLDWEQPPYPPEPPAAPVRVEMTHPPPDNTLTYYKRGHALGSQGRYKEAEAAYREAIRLRPDYAEAHCNLGYVLRAQGRFAESLTAYRRGHELGTKTPGWRYPSADWVRQAERRVALDAKLPAVLRDDAAPADAAEAAELAECVLYRQKPAAAIRLFEAAFAAEPALAQRPGLYYRYNAACAAALAAAGRGTDAAAALPAKLRASLRRQALAWLGADLAAWQQRAAADRAAAGKTMTHWQADPDLAGVRGPQELAKLPAAERAEWEKLWADVAALLKQTQTGPAR